MVVTKTLKRLLSRMSSHSSKSSTNDQGLKILCYSLDFLSNFAQPKSAMKEALNSVYNSIFMARYVPRFWGLPNSLDGLLNNTWSETPNKWKGEEMMNEISRLQAGTMTLYHPFELLAWLGWVTKWDSNNGGGGRKSKWRDPNLMSAYSCR